MPFILSDSCDLNPHSMLKEIFLIEVNIMQMLGLEVGAIACGSVLSPSGKRESMFFIVNEIAVL